MPEPLVRFLGVSKSFGRAEVLRRIDLDVPSGKCLGLAGVNGAGKTTLIKCLLDFCELDSGSIAPYFLTGREFIAMMLRLFERRYEEVRVRAMFASLDLDVAALDKPVRTYSKGMTQKLGLAACFLSERDLYVLDEPMSGLDPKARACAKELILKLISEGRTLLFTSHSLADIEEVCDDMTVLHRGTLAYTGAPRGLCERHGESSLERAFLKCIETHA